MLILVRHARTVLNAEGRLQGRSDPALDEVGQQQALGLAERLSTDRVVRVITSPLLRARATAEVVTDRHDLVPEVDPAWIELDYGVLEGVAIGAVGAEVWRAWREDPDFAPDGGESFTSLDERVHGACERIHAERPDGDVVVVSHVSPIKSAVAWALGASTTIAHRMRLGQAAVSRIDVSGDRPVLVSFDEWSPGSDAD